MPKYTYRAVNQRGRPVRGVLTANSESDLFMRMQQNGMSLIDCHEQTDRKGKLSVMLAPAVKARDLIQVFVHMEQLQLAGVPLLDAISDVKETTESARLRDIMTDVFREVSDGSSLSEALARHNSVFEPIFISLISAGEDTGNLSKSFAQVIHHLKWTDAMNSKVKKATRYPKILLVVVMGVIYLMMAKVVPEVTGFLQNIGQDLPSYTLALIATSDFIQNYFLYIIGAIIFLYVLMKILRGVWEEFRYRTDYLILHMPVFGPLIRKISLSRFCQTFAVLFTSGLEILRCLDSAKQTAGNMVIAEALENVRTQVQEGSPLSVAMNNCGEFPSLVVRMMRIGEESGNLTGVLEQVAEFYDKDVNESVDAMIQMIEPALTVFLGGMIMWIAAAVFGPIYGSFGEMEF